MFGKLKYIFLFLFLFLFLFFKIYLKDKSGIDIKNSKFVRLIDFKDKLSVKAFNNYEKREKLPVSISLNNIKQSKKRGFIYKIPDGVFENKYYRVLDFHYLNLKASRIRIYLLNSKRRIIKLVYNGHIRPEKKFKHFSKNLDNIGFRYFRKEIYDLSYLLIKTDIQNKIGRDDFLVKDIFIKKIIHDEGKKIRETKIRMDGNIIDSLVIPLNSEISFKIKLKDDLLLDGYFGNISDSVLSYRLFIDNKLNSIIEINKTGWKYFKINLDNKGSGIINIRIKVNGNSSGILGNIIISNNKNSAKEPGDVFLYLIDALRSDFGSIPLNKLNFFKIFKDGMIFKNAYSNATRTADSIPSMFTGKYKFIINQNTNNLPFVDDIDYTLAEYLKERGFVTAAFVANAWLITSNSHQGFDFVHYTWSKKLEDIVKKGDVSVPITKEVHEFIKNGDVLNSAADFIEKRKHLPLFVFIHTMETHAPYIIPEKKRVYSNDVNNKVYRSVFPEKGDFFKYLKNPDDKQIDAVKKAYQDNVIDADINFKDFYNFLNKENLIKNSLLILTSDHGERLFEHKTWAHGKPDIYNEVLRIPLMIKGKFINKKYSDIPVQLIDLFPTIKDWLDDGVEDINSFIGDSLFKISKNDKDRLIFSDGFKNNLYSFTDLKNKIIFNNHTINFYNIEKNVFEKKSLSIKDFRKLSASKIKNLIEFKEKYLKRIKKKKEKRKMDKKDIERLKTLGYL